MNISDLHNKEVEHWKARNRQSVRLCKTILQYIDYITQIKGLLALDDVTGAEQLFNELSYEVQRDLMTAPLNGGPFTTKERAVLKSIWTVSQEDLTCF